MMCLQEKLIILTTIVIFLLNSFFSSPISSLWEKLITSSSLKPCHNIFIAFFSVEVLESPTGMTAEGQYPYYMMVTAVIMVDSKMIIVKWKWLK